MTQNFQSYAHCAQRDFYAYWAFWLTVGAIVPAATILPLSFMADDFAVRALHLTADQVRITNTAIALFCFICVLVQQIWKPDSLAAAHGLAAEHFATNPGARPLDEVYISRTAPISQARMLRLKRRHARELSLMQQFALTTSGFAQ